MSFARLWPTFLVGTTHMVVAGAITPLIPLYVVARGGSPATVGAVAASAAVLPLALGIWTGAGADALGPRRLSAAGALGLAAATALIASAPGVGVIILGAAIAGLANNVLILSSQTSVAQVSRARDHDHNFGLFAFSVSIGQVLGPLVGGVLADALSTRAALYLCAAAALVPALLSLGLPTARPRPERDEQTLRAERAYRAAWSLARRPDLRFILWVAFIIIFAWSIKSSFYPLYLQSVGLSKSSIGLVFACLGAGSLVVRPLVGLAAARFGRRRVLLRAVMVATVAIGLIPFMTRIAPLALAAVVTGMAWGFTQPLTMSLMASGVARGERGLALSLRMTSNRLAEVISPILFATLVAAAGLRSAFFFSAAALAVGVWIIGRGAVDEAGRAAGQTGMATPPLLPQEAAAMPAPPAPVPPDRG
jgi:MFS family permease